MGTRFRVKKFKKKTAETKLIWDTYGMLRDAGRIAVAAVVL